MRYITLLAFGSLFALFAAALEMMSLPIGVWAIVVILPLLATLPFLIAGLVRMCRPR